MLVSLLVVFIVTTSLAIYVFTHPVLHQGGKALTGTVRPAEGVVYGGVKCVAPGFIPVNAAISYSRSGVLLYVRVAEPYVSLHHLLPTPVIRAFGIAKPSRVNTSAATLELVGINMLVGST